MAKWQPRTCVCGKSIKWNRQLCGSCLRKHGTKSSAWPEWLQRWVSSVQSEIDSARRHDELPLPDEDDAGIPRLDDDVRISRALTDLRLGRDANGNGRGTVLPGLETYDNAEAGLIAEETVAAILERLTTKQKKALTLSDMGYNQAQIAERLGCSQPAVSDRLRRVRVIAAECMEIKLPSPRVPSRPRRVKRRSNSVYAEPNLRYAPYGDERLNETYRRSSDIKKGKYRS